jgi:hypothetical protein
MKSEKCKIMDDRTGLTTQSKVIFLDLAVKCMFADAKNLCGLFAAAAQPPMFFC